MIMDTVRTYTELMLTRRGYVIGDFTDIDEEGVAGKKPRLVVTKPDGTQAIVFFVHKKSKTDKVTINVVKAIISMAKEITHILIVHDTVLTSDAKHNITNSSDDVIALYQFETFSFDELSYDLLDIQRHSPDINFLNKALPGVNKLPILLSTDPLARYLRIRHGDIVKGRFGDEMITIRRCVTP
jgi:hypothetical protein